MEEVYSSDEDDHDVNNRAEEVESEDSRIDYKKKAIAGSFLPAMILLDQKKIDVEEPINTSQGLRLLHYASFFGKIKALRALVEEFKADITAIDYKAQTPLHVATSS